MTKRSICSKEAFNSSALSDVYVTGWAGTERADSLMRCLHPEIYDPNTETVCDHTPEKPIFQSPVTAFHYARTSKRPLRSFFFELPAPRVNTTNAEVTIGQSNKQPSHSPVAQYVGIDAEAALRDYLEYTKQQPDGKNFYSCNVAFAIATIEEYMKRNAFEAEAPCVFIISHKKQSQGIAQMVADFTGLQTYALPERIIEDYKGKPIEVLGSLDKLKAIATKVEPQIDRPAAMARYGLSEEDRKGVLNDGPFGHAFKDNEWSGVQYI